MKKLLITLGALCLVFSFFTTANATNWLWGVTNGTNDVGFWTGGQIFTVDPLTGTTIIKSSYGSSTLFAFGDIAVRANGEVYVTYYGNDGFDKLAKVNTTTWAFDWVQDLGGWYDQVNALNFIGDDLYGVTGGGIAANLLKFTLTGGGATVTNLGSLGTNSDGDIAMNYIDGKVYYTSWETGNTGELNVVNFGPPPSKTGIETNYSGWSGIEFLNNTLYAGTYWDQNLYTMNTTTGVATQLWDLSATLGGTITGLSAPIPEPGTFLLLGFGLLGLAGLSRKRIFKK